MHTAATIGVILVPVGLIAVMLALWYFPFRRSSHSDPGVEAGNVSTERPDLVHPDSVARPDMVHHRYAAPSFEIDPRQSFRLSRISEEGGPSHHHHHHIVTHK